MEAWLSRCRKIRRIFSYWGPVRGKESLWSGLLETCSQLMLPSLSDDLTLYQADMKLASTITISPFYPLSLWSPTVESIVPWVPALPCCFLHQRLMSVSSSFWPSGASAGWLDGSASWRGPVVTMASQRDLPHPQIRLGWSHWTLSCHTERSPSCYCIISSVCIHEWCPQEEGCSLYIISPQKRLCHKPLLN